MTNNVLLSGVVKSIDLDARDIVVTTKTPKLGKDVDVKVHMWKFNDGVEAHNNRDDWTSLAVGDFVIIGGHMGNNGRVVATGYGTDNSSVDDEE